MEKLTNQDRFDTLRGYCNGWKFHPKGGEVVSGTDLLRQMEFKELRDFWVWYKSLAQEEIKNGKKDWCSGNCCQSILAKLLEMEKIQEKKDNPIDKKTIDHLKQLFINALKEANELSDGEE